MMTFNPMPTDEEVIERANMMGARVKELGWPANVAWLFEDLARRLRGEADAALLAVPSNLYTGDGFRYERLDAATEAARTRKGDHRG